MPTASPRAALAHCDRTIELAPNHSLGHAARAMILHYAGDSAGTLEECAIAMRLDPHYNDMTLHLVGQAHFMLGRYEEAAEAFRRRLRINPHSDISNAWLAASYGYLGRREDAHEAWRRTLESNPEYSLEQKRRILPYQNPEDFDRIVEGLAHVGLPAK